MNEILSKITPLTRSIIWLTDRSDKIQSVNYKAIDYLINGLLTASTSSRPNIESRIFFSNNFGRPFLIYIGQDIKSRDFDSFQTLLQKEMTQESSVLVIDEMDIFHALLTHAAEDIRPRLQLLK